MKDMAKLLNDSAGFGFRPVYERTVKKVECPTCKAAAIKVFGENLPGYVVVKQAAILVHKENNKCIIHACPVCGYRKQLNKPEIKKEKKPDQSVPMCTRCGKYPIPEGRIALCYEWAGPTRTKKAPDTNY